MQNPRVRGEHIKEEERGTETGKGAKGTGPDGEEARVEQNGKAHIHTGPAADGETKGHPKGRGRGIKGSVPNLEK